MCAGRKRARGISCVVITYFYVAFFTIVVLVYIGIVDMILQTGLDVSSAVCVVVVAHCRLIDVITCD